jgi:hypothetical protein
MAFLVILMALLSVSYWSTYLHMVFWWLPMTCMCVPSLLSVASCSVILLPTAFIWLAYGFP